MLMHYEAQTLWVKNHVPVSETLLAPETLFEHSTDIGLTSKSKVTYFIFHFVH